MVATDHNACRIGRCVHGHVDFCPVQPGFRPARKTRSRISKVGRTLTIDRLNGGNDIGLISEALSADRKFLGQRYIFEASTAEGERQIIKAFSDMFKDKNPAEIMADIMEVRRNGIS